MHPRTPRHAWDAKTRRKAAEILAFIRARGPTHPRVVEEHFAHGRRINAWGGSSQATTHLLYGMHYRGLLRVRRDHSEEGCRTPADGESHECEHYLISTSSIASRLGPSTITARVSPSR